jgi:hypothetical protein
MREWVFLCCVATVPLAGCQGGVDSSAPTADAGIDAAFPPPPLDAAAPEGASTEAGTIATTFRIVHLSPDLGPFDFCYRMAPGTWTGPVLAGGAEAGPAPAIMFATSSPYLTLPSAGTFDMALVAAGDQSCVHPLAIGHVTLDAGKRTTLAVMGLDHADGAASALTLTAFLDDPAPAPSSARVRFVNAALGDSKSPGAGALTVSIAAPPVAAVLAGEVAPGAAARASSRPPFVDSLGYARPPPITGLASLSLAPFPLPEAGAPAPPATPSVDLGLSIGSVHTAFILSDGLGGLAILWCDDLAPAPACGVLSAK